MSGRMAGTIPSVRVSAVDDTDRHDSRSLSQSTHVWTTESDSLQNLREGDHVWCYTRGRKNAIQHHGIFDGTGVYHFDVADDDKDGKPDYYSTCSTCISRLNQRKKAGLGSSDVRFNCLSCFSRGQPVYRCEYAASIGGLVLSETGSRSTRVCNRSGEEVVREAKRLYENNEFGKNRAMYRNCEDFARWCKIGKLGSKQVMRAELLLFGGIVVAGVVGHAALKGLRKWHERKLEKRHQKPDEKRQEPLL